MNQYDELYISGQCLTLAGREICAPLCVLRKLSESSCKVSVIAHHWQTSNAHGYWFSMSFRSKKASKEAFERLRNMYPAAKTVSEILEADSGGRGPLGKRRG